MSKVYFTDLRTSLKRNLFNKIEDLLNRTKIDTRIKKNDLTAIKLHFGEYGNTAYMRPVFLRIIVDKVKRAGGKPFLTDTNTLYTGSRSDSVSHLTTAIMNGFDYSCTGAPLIIADGLRGSGGGRIAIDGEALKEVHIAKEILDADSMIVVTHFKAHEITGFGGALKNVGMGCATREGKLIQHSTVAPKVNIANCKGCRFCLEYCPAQAIAMTEKKASINGGKCIGCGECILVCPHKAIEIQWNESPDIFQKKMVEYAFGALKGKEKRVVFLNFLMQISPACDCYPHSDTPIVRDIGILASTDPVAIDAASCDMVNSEASMPHSAIKTCLGAGEDKWHALFPRIDWSVQLSHGEKIGLGERAYTLVKI
ncbi:MAG: 4Fe-4S ferredoxin [Syntrophus sp. (in: bacteria)]|nr:4Fe-4S ferredoxin [Syntrophus sp. (in: bacteria)]